MPQWVMSVVDDNDNNDGRKKDVHHIPQWVMSVIDNNNC